MIAGGVRVPGGFAVTTDAYALHLRSNGLSATIAERLSRIEVDNVDEEETLSHEIRDAIVAQAMPAIVEQAIREGYRRISPNGQLPVAIRSSATAEDLPDASFAGQQDTYLWVVGEDFVVEKVKACWASLFNARAISYRAKNRSRPNRRANGCRRAENGQRRRSGRGDDSRSDHWRPHQDRHRIPHLGSANPLCQGKSRRTISSSRKS